MEKPDCSKDTHSPNVPASHLPFSQAVRHGDLLFVSGQASVDRWGKLVPDSFEGEMRRAMGHLRAVLLANGSDLDQVLQVRAYVDNPEDLITFNSLYREYFTKPFPARTTLLNCFRGLLKFEIDCMAVSRLP